ncbi:MAG: hypothetical protein AAF899_04590 [Pseudomonadota bacterium]
MTETAAVTAVANTASNVIPFARCFEKPSLAARGRVGPSEIARIEAMIDRLVASVDGAAVESTVVSLDEYRLRRALNAVDRNDMPLASA